MNRGRRTYAAQAAAAARATEQERAAQAAQAAAAAHVDHGGDFDVYVDSPELARHNKLTALKNLLRRLGDRPDYVAVLGNDATWEQYTEVRNNLVRVKDMLVPIIRAHPTGEVRLVQETLLQMIMAFNAANVPNILSDEDMLDGGPPSPPGAASVLQLPGAPVRPLYPRQPPAMSALPRPDLSVSWSSTDLPRSSREEGRSPVHEESRDRFLSLDWDYSQASVDEAAPLDFEDVAAANYDSLLGSVQRAQDTRRRFNALPE